MNGSLARRYARAFLEIAKGEKDGAISSLGEELSLVAQTMEENAVLFQTLANETLAVNDRKEILKQIAEKLKCSTLTQNFFMLLLDKTRISLTPEIAKYYREFADIEQGILRASVRSATTLDGHAKKDIEKELSRITGMNVDLALATDEKLIGGMVTEIGHTVFDGSVITHLENMRKSMCK